MITKKQIKMAIKVLKSAEPVMSKKELKEMLEIGLREQKEWSIFINKVKRLL